MKTITLSCKYLVPYKAIIEKLIKDELMLDRDSKSIYIPDAYLQKFYVSNRSAWLVEILEDYLDQIDANRVEITSLSELFRHALIYHFELKPKKKKKQKKIKKPTYEIVEHETPLYLDDYQQPQKLFKIYSHDFVANLLISYLHEYQELTLKDFENKSNFSYSVFYKAYNTIRKDYPELIIKYKCVKNTKTQNVFSLNYDVFETLMS